MEIINMKELNKFQLTQAAQVLTDVLPLGWATLSDAMDELSELLNGEATLLAAVENGEVVGWCGIRPEYRGNIFELHPLAVRGDRQHKGIGRLLMENIEKAARERGGLVIFLGADDERPGGETSLANVDLFDNLPKHIQEFEPGTHQTAFYLKLGYKIVGVVPDANGIGKPDIFMAKRLY